jgi:hypothetical protein
MREGTWHVSSKDTIADFQKQDTVATNFAMAVFRPIHHRINFFQGRSLSLPDVRVVPVLDVRLSVSKMLMVSLHLSAVCMPLSKDTGGGR